MRLILAVVWGLLALSSAYAQQAGFRPDTATSTATLSVTSVSSSTSAGTALLALVCNTGTQEAFVAIGPSNVAATTSGMSFPGGFCTSLQLNPGNYLAAITASSTTTLRVTYGSGTPPIAGAGSGGGGSGGLSVTDQTTWTQGSSAFTPNGGVFNDTATLSSGQEGTVRLSAAREMYIASVGIGLPADAACATDTGTCSVEALLKRANQQLTAGIVPTGTFSAPSATLLSTTSMPRVAQLSSAALDFSSSGNNTLVTRAVGTIKVYGIAISCASALTSITFQNGTSTSVGKYYNVTSIALGSAASGVTAEPLWTTTSTNNFVGNLSSGVNCGGNIYYLDN